MIHFFLSSVPPLLRQTKERGRRVKTARPITGLGLLKPRNYSSAQTAQNIREKLHKVCERPVFAPCSNELKLCV